MGLWDAVRTYQAVVVFVFRPARFARWPIPVVRGVIGPTPLDAPYQASVRAHVRGRSQVIKVEVRALSAQDARGVLRAQWGFHGIQDGPVKVKVQS